MNSSMRYLAVAAGLAMAVSASAGPRDEVVAAFGAMKAKNAFRAKGTTQSDGKVSTIDMAVQLPDRFHIRTDGNEIIVHPSGTWMNAGGQWMKMPMDMSAMARQYTPEAMEQAMAGIETVSRAGEETIAGCASKGYRYHATATVAGIRSESDNTLWICSSNGLPIRVQTDGTAMGMRSNTTLDYDWNTPVDIRPPQ